MANFKIFCFCALFFWACADIPDYGTLKVIASPSNGGSVSKNPSGPEYEEGTTVTLTANVNNGYVFSGWQGDVSIRSGSTNTATIIIYGDKMVTANFEKIPNTPSNIKAIVDSPNSITVSWSSVLDVAGYYIYRSVDSNGPFNQVGSVSSISTSYTNTGLSAGTTYYYKVAAYSSSIAISPQSNAVSATTQPNAPIGVTATANSENSITVNWSSVYGATGYYIYRSLASDGNFTQIESVSSASTSYSNTELSAGTTYYYRVAAYNSSGVSNQSNTVNATTQLSVPTSVTTTVNSANSVTVNWSSVYGATGYYIYRSTTSNGTFSQVGSSTTTSYMDTGLSAGTTYYYKVAAYNNATTGNQSSAVNATTQSGTPTGVTATANSANSVIVNWSSVSGATGYYIYRSTTSNGTFSQVGSSTTTSYMDTGLSAGITYYYKVAAYNSGGTGNQSSTVNATIQPSAPTGVTATASSTTSITVGWYSISGATGYYIYRSNASNGTFSLVGSSTTTSYMDTGLSTGTTYYYKVAAYNSGGTGNQSNTVSAATQ